MQAATKRPVELCEQDWNKQQPSLLRAFFSFFFSFSLAFVRSSPLLLILDELENERERRSRGERREKYDGDDDDEGERSRESRQEGKGGGTSSSLFCAAFQLLFLAPPSVGEAAQRCHLDMPRATLSLWCWPGRCLSWPSEEPLGPSLTECAWSERQTMQRAIQGPRLPASKSDSSSDSREKRKWLRILEELHCTLHCFFSLSLCLSRWERRRKGRRLEKEEGENKKEKTNERRTPSLNRSKGSAVGCKRLSRTSLQASLRVSVFCFFSYKKEDLWLVGGWVDGWAHSRVDALGSLAKAADARPYV